MWGNKGGLGGAAGEGREKQGNTSVPYIREQTVLIGPILLARECGDVVRQTKELSTYIRNILRGLVS